jgi:hypothetical protein
MTAGTVQKIAVEAVKRITGNQFCPAHQGHVASDAGSMVERGRVRYFKCFNCQSKGKK